MMSDVAKTALHVAAFMRVTSTLWLGAATGRCNLSCMSASTRNPPKRLKSAICHRRCKRKKRREFKLNVGVTDMAAIWGF